MATGNKIALFGAGSIGRVLLAGTAALNFVAVKNDESVFDSDMLQKILEPADYTSLVRAYKNVQRKYNPEKDALITRNLINE